MNDQSFIPQHIKTSNTSTDIFLAETCFPISNQSSTGNLDKDGGDCAPFKYPNCIIYNPFSTDMRLSKYGEEESQELGDDVCDQIFNTKECEWDGEDCEEFNKDYPNCDVDYPSYIGSGHCYNVAPYNTVECGWDGGDCVEFNAEYPDCTATYPSFIGNGICNDAAPYNTAECGYDGGDCLR